jgi:hypothetical protein
MGIGSRWQSARVNPLMLVVAAAILGFGIWQTVAGVQAALGNGISGTFIAQTVNCGRHSCSWQGLFERTDGVQVSGNTTYQGSVNGMVPGSVVPAVYESSDGDAYPPHSLAWIGSLLFVGAGIFLAHQWFRGSRGSGASWRPGRRGKADLHVVT